MTDGITEAREHISTSGGGYDVTTHDSDNEWLRRKIGRQLSEINRDVHCLEASRWIGHKWDYWDSVYIGTLDDCRSRLSKYRERIPYNKRWRIIRVIEEVEA